MNQEQHLPEPSVRQDTANSTVLFRNSWTVYDSVVAANHMNHREIHGNLSGWLARDHSPARCRFLDLGCGNARVLSAQLATIPGLIYTGVDLSAAALAEARENLGPLGAVRLLESDIHDFLAGCHETFDVIFSAFVLHHLDSKAKRSFFGRATERLADDGVFLLIDVVRQPGESREEAVAAYVRMMREEWRDFDPGHCEEACTHVLKYDFPESPETLESMAVEAGGLMLTRITAFGRHRVMRFTRKGSEGTASITWPAGTGVG